MTHRITVVAGEERIESKIRGFAAVAASTDTVTMEPR